MKLLSLLVFGLLVAAATVSAGEVSKKMLKKIAMLKFFDSCWGKENMKDFWMSVKTSTKKCQGLRPTFDLDIFEDKPNQGYPMPNQPAGPAGFDRNSNNNLNINNPYEAWLAFLKFQQSQQNQGRRFRRAIKVPTAEQIADFKVNIMEFKENKLQNIGNLTCVLADMGILDSNLNINIDFYTRGWWSQVIEQPDPAFKARIIESYEDCHSVAQSIPQAVLDKNPFYKKFGRNMIFFKCAYKAELNLCAKQEISKYFEEMYGPANPNMLKDLGLPEDKFDAAYMKKKVMLASMSDSEKFVWKVMMGQKD